MAYQVYFGDLAEENQALVLAVLKFKEESGTLEEGEAELLYRLRGSSTPSVYPPLEDAPQQPRQNSRPSGNGGGGGRRPSARRGSNNGRGRPQPQSEG
jgi:hypothetical protein